eukprot:COSAG02_NODE_1366_length_13032_cov_721.428207_6_plen_179_part_00
MLTAHPPPSPPPPSTEVWASSPALYGATSPSPAHPHRRRAHSDDRFAEQGNITEKSGRAELSDFWRVLFWNTIGISSVVGLVAPMRAGDGTREYHRRFSGCILLPLQLSPSSSRHILVVRPGSGHWPLAAGVTSDFRMHDEGSNDVCGGRTLHGWNPENDGFSLMHKTYTAEGNSCTA